MKKINTKEGGSSQKSSNDIIEQGSGKAKAKIGEDEKTEKRTQRIALRSSPKPTSRITLRSKGKEAQASKHQRPPTIGSLKSKPASNAHDGAPSFSSYSGRSPPTILHSRKVAETQYEQSSILPAKSSGVSPRGTGTTSRQRTGQSTKPSSPKANCNDAASSPKAELSKQDKIEFEHLRLRELSQVTGPNTFLVKLLSDRTLSRENANIDWEPVGYPRPASPTTVSIPPATTVYNDLKSEVDHAALLVKDDSSLHEINRPLKDIQAATGKSSSNPAESKQLVSSVQDGKDDFESTIRSILTQNSRGRSRKNMSRDSVKSVRWDPSINSIGPLTPPSTASIGSEQIKPRGEGRSLEKSLEDFSNTVKDLKKGDRRILAQLLEALRDVESDDDSSSTPTASVEMNGEPPVEVAQMVTNSPMVVTSSHESNTTNPAAKDKKSYKDALTSNLAPSAANKQRVTEERSEPAPRGQALNTARSLNTTIKLNPQAPVFAGFTQKRHQRAAQSDPVEESYPFISTFRKKNRSCEEGDKSEDTSAPKVEKYVPPALRGDRNPYSPTKKPQEPVWVKVRTEQTPNKWQGNGPEKFENPKSYQSRHEEPTNPVSGVQHSQTDWITEWLHDAAKPDHGLGNGYVAELQHALGEVQLQKSSYEQAIQDIGLSTQVHENSIPYANDLLGPPLPMDWAPINLNMIQYPYVPHGYPPWPLQMVGPLIPIPPPPLLFGHSLLQDSASVPLQTPLIPVSAAYDAPVAPNTHAAIGNKAGRIAHTLSPAWGDRVLDKFTSRFPMTGKSQSNFPVPPIQGLDTKAAQIQQKLELLILQQKEKAAFAKRTRGGWSDNTNSDLLSFSTNSSSEKLIRLD